MSRPHGIPTGPERPARTDPAGLLLAAGSASRFGAVKMLAPFRGQPLVRHAVRALLAAGVGPVLVVVPRIDGFDAALDDLDVRLVVNADADSGMASSIRAGILALPATAEAVLIALGDQPTVPRDQLERLVERHTHGSAAITASEYGGVLAPPVIFERSVFPELMRLTGDHGARALLAGNPGRVERVRFEHHPPDIDTPEDLTRMERLDGQA